MNRDLTKLSKKKLERIRKLCLKYGALEGNTDNGKVAISAFVPNHMSISFYKAGSVFDPRNYAYIRTGMDGFEVGNTSSSWGLKCVTKYNKEIAECLSFLSEARDIDKMFVKE